MPQPVTHVPEQLCHLCGRYLPGAGRAGGAGGTGAKAAVDRIGSDGGR